MKIMAYTVLFLLNKLMSPCDVGALVLFQDSNFVSKSARLR